MRKEVKETLMQKRKIDQLVASFTCPNQDGSHYPGMCPDRECNWRPFSLWDGAQLDEMQWSGLCLYSLD